MTKTPEERRDENFNTPMRFKVELQMNDRVFTKVYFAIHLQDLSEQITKEFPKAKVVGAIGGGC